MTVAAEWSSLHFLAISYTELRSPVLVCQSRNGSTKFLRGGMIFSKTVLLNNVSQYSFVKAGISWQFAHELAVRLVAVGFLQFARGGLPDNG